MNLCPGPGRALGPARGDLAQPCDSPVTPAV